MVGNTKTKGEHGYDKAYECYQYYDDGDVHVWHVHDFRAYLSDVLSISRVNPCAA